jgi:hypothetical protein
VALQIFLPKQNHSLGVTKDHGWTTGKTANPKFSPSEACHQVEAVCSRPHHKQPFSAPLDVGIGISSKWQSWAHSIAREEANYFSSPQPPLCCSIYFTYNVVAFTAAHEIECISFLFFSRELVEHRRVKRLLCSSY